MRNQNNRWKLLLFVSVIAWSFCEMYPPVKRDLTRQFQTTKAIRKDATFAEILARQQRLQQERPEHAFANLLEAVVGTQRHLPLFSRIRNQGPDGSFPARF